MIVENRIAGTRITVWDVLHHLENGWAVDDIAEVFSLSAEQIQAAVDYIDAHRSEVMKVHREIEERNAQGNSPEVKELLHRAHASRVKRMEQRQQPIAR